MGLITPRRVVGEDQMKLNVWMFKKKQKQSAIDQQASCFHCTLGIFRATDFFF